MVQVFLLGFGASTVIARSNATKQSILSLPPDGLLRFARNDGNLFHSATAMRSRLKVWNESGTKRARIADSYPNPIRSPQHLALKRFGQH